MHDTKRLHQGLFSVTCCRAKVARFNRKAKFGSWLAAAATALALSLMMNAGPAFAQGSAPTRNPQAGVACSPSPLNGDLQPAPIASPAIVSTAPASTFVIIHDFTGGPDGAHPYAGLAMDQRGNLYGTTSPGGRNYGSVYKLSRQGSGWILSPLYNFRGWDDGLDPRGELTFGRDGVLYGTTRQGGGDGYGCEYEMACGTIYALSPAAHVLTGALDRRLEHQLYFFSGYSDGDGGYPTSDLVLDREGNVYGTTRNGGYYGGGAIFRIAQTSSGWQYQQVTSFSGGDDGDKPIDSLISDASGNLYGATNGGGIADCGTIFELIPYSNGWREQTLYHFRGQQDTGNPIAMVMDQLGNLYGVTMGRGANAVFRLAPQDDGSWSYTVLDYFYSGNRNNDISIDAAGNLYVVVSDTGILFKLSPSGGPWIHTELHQFSEAWPLGRMVIDASGNLYGVMTGGGAHGYGAVWEITP